MVGRARSNVLCGTSSRSIGATYLLHLNLWCADPRRSCTLHVDWKRPETSTVLYDTILVRTVFFACIQGGM